MKKRKNKTILDVPLIISSRKKNLNGRIYSKKLLKDILPDLKKRAEDRKLLGEFGYGETSNILLTNVSHIIHNLRIEEKTLFGDVEILSTDKGQELSKDVKKFVFRPRGFGFVDEKGNINSYELISFDAIPEEEDSFKNVV